MKYGLSAQQLQEITGILAAYEEVETAVLFGSRAIDTYKEASDVDIAIKGEKADFGLALSIKDHLEEETYLPFFFDVISYQSISNEELKKHIRTKGKVMYRKSMKEWREIRLERYIKTNKKSIGMDFPYQEILYLDTGSITKNKIDKLQEFSLTNAPSRAKRIVEEEDIIYSSVRPNQLHYGFIKNPKDNLVVSTGFVVISCDKEFLEPKYLYYFLASENSTEYLHSIAEASTSAYPSLKPRDIETLEILLPPLPEQKAIASVLSSLDDKIDLLHRQNQTLEQLAETLFRQWFVEEADEGWGEGCLGDVIEIFDSKRIPLSKMQRLEMKIGKMYPYYGAAKIMDYVNDFIFDGEYILFAEDGTVKTDEGYPVLQYATGQFWVNNHTHILRAKKPYSNFFIWCYLVKKNIEKYITGAVQPKINQSNLKSIDFPKFPGDLVENWNVETEPIFGKINQNKTQIKTITNLRDTLLPKLMSGEVRVEMEN